MQHHACSQSLVLIVEDEVILRWAAAEAAIAAGFGVVEAGNAIEAISILEKREDIGVVFTDVHMPGAIDGLQLAQVPDLVSSRRLQSPLPDFAIRRRGMPYPTGGTAQAGAAPSPPSSF